MTCNGDCNQGRECNCERKMKQHKWHKEIKAWADGAEIEFRNLGSIDNGEWRYMENTDWYVYLGYEYRIKPQPKEPKYLYAYIFNGVAMLTETHSGAANGGRYIGKIEVQDD